MMFAMSNPFGFLLSFICTKNALLKSFLFGAAFSACIELSQLFFKRGLCEFDDLFHNTLGSVVGCGIGMPHLSSILSLARREKM